LGEIEGLVGGRGRRRRINPNIDGRGDGPKKNRTESLRKSNSEGREWIGRPPTGRMAMGGKGLGIGPKGRIGQQGIKRDG
jgi:hypothetical protein